MIPNGTTMKVFNSKLISRYLKMMVENMIPYLTEKYREWIQACFGFETVMDTKDTKYNTFYGMVLT